MKRQFSCNEDMIYVNERYWISTDGIYNLKTEVQLYSFEDLRSIAAVVTESGTLMFGGSDGSEKTFFLHTNFFA